MNLIQMFENKLRDTKLNKSKGTYLHDYGHTRHFLNWCRDNKVIDSSDFLEDELIDYINHMRSTCVERTVNKRIGIIKRTFKFNNIRFEFLENLQKFKEANPEIQIIDFKVFSAMRKYSLEMPEDTELELLRKTFFVLLLNTGARFNEIRHIEKKNIDYKEYSILLTTTKTQNHRFIYFAPQYSEVLKRMSKASKSKYLLFDSTKNNIITYEFAVYLMKLLIDRFNLQNLTTHMFRHTIGAYLFDREISDIVLQQILGHSDIATTRIYAHPRKIKVLEIYQREMKKLG